MSDDLKLSMSIDGDKLLNAINEIHDLISNFIKKVQTPITLNVDMSNFTDVINSSIKNVKTTAIDGASQVETAIQSSAD